MGNNRWQQFVRRCVEIVVTLFLVLVFFSLITTVLFRIFPSGITLSQIVQQGKGVAEGVAKGGAERGSVLDVAGTRNEKAAATLSRTENEVKSKSASSLAWGPAKGGMSLFDRDAVQTFSQASAQINFDSRNYLTLGSKSLVIIKRIERDPNLNQRRTALIIVEGELQGRIASSGQHPLQLEVATPSAVARVFSGKSGAPKTDFRVSVNPDQSSSIVVYRGEAEVSALGRTVKVTENSGVTVRQGQAPQAAVPLPAAPALTAPAERSVIHFRELAPRVRLAWAGKAGETFRLQLARDAAFKEMVVDRRCSGPEFVHGNLKKGSYYWRVSSVDQWREGRFAETRRFEIVQQLSAPTLLVSFPVGTVAEDSFILSGTTAPGSKVFVGGKPASTDGAGAFSFEVAIRPGMNLVTVEAVDPVGNVSYRSHYVQGRF